MTGKFGKCPWKNPSFIVTFLIPTIRLNNSISVILSIRRNGYRWGRMLSISFISMYYLLFQLITHCFFYSLLLLLSFQCLPVFFLFQAGLQTQPLPLTSFDEAWPACLRPFPRP